MLRSTRFIHYKEIYYFSICCQQIFCGRKLLNPVKYCSSSNFHKLILASVFYLSVLAKLINTIVAKCWFSNSILYCIFIITILSGRDFSMYLHIYLLIHLFMYYLNWYKNIHIQRERNLVTVHNFHSVLIWTFSS